MLTNRTVWWGVISGIIVTILLFISQILFTGIRELTPIENIKGIPFAYRENAWHITEKLAHADIRLHEPSLAKTAEVTLAFEPKAITTLAVGIRDNSFWLSYEPTVIYDRSQPATGIIETTVQLPLTAALQDKDRSVDLMFFAATDHTTAAIDDSASETTYWLLHRIDVQVQPTAPSWGELKDYIRSTITRERPL
jgi:hypothetical protein